MITGKVIDRLIAKIDMSGGPDACWPWKGAKSKKRRGRKGIIRIGFRVVIAARVICALKTDGDYNVPLEACHSCGNGGNEIDCHNPAHLYWGDRVDQLEDKRRKQLQEITAALAN